MDGNELQSEVGSMGKAKQLRWDFAMDSALINTLVESAKQGHKQGCVWQKHVVDLVTDAVYEKTHQVVEKKHIENRTRTMRVEYKIFAELKEMEGFEWDPVKQIITAPYDRWEELIKQKSIYKSYRDRGPKWDFEKLSIIFCNDQNTDHLAVAVKGQNVDDVDESASVSTTALDMDDNELQSEVESMGKSKQLRWDFAMDSALINTLVEAANQGHKQGCVWQKHVWNLVTDAVYKKTHQVVERKHIENRTRTMRVEYKIFAELKEMEGFEWDPVKQIITAPYDRWEDLIMQKSKYKSYRDRGPKWDFEKLSIIFGNDQNTDDLAVVVKGQNVDDIFESASVSTTGIGKRPSPSTQKRQHGKKTRIIRSLKDMIEGMNARIEQIAKSVDPMTFSKTLYTEVMKTEGFSSEYLDSAFAILRREPMEAEIFLVRSVESKKKMLEGLRDKIGDI